LVPKVYSQTRRKRGESPYTFDIVDVVRRGQPRWLRSRMA
jgi:hypothetical protein